VSALLVLDTNIVLDVFVFDDANAKPLAAALREGAVQWIATQPMRDELERVLAYPQIVTRLAFYALSAESVLSHFDRHARIVEAPPKARVTCTDPDDQKFIDLAVAHRCAILSKDAAVLSMKKRLAALEVAAASAFS
jgi:putative PIN family toxin of toxin-antitoxin system